MIFEEKSLPVVFLLDLAKGPRYNETMHDEGGDDELDCIYKITTQSQEWVNPIVEGRISWGHANSCTKDSDEQDEWWHNQLNEVTTLNCNMMTKSLYCIRAQDHKLLMYDGLTTVDEFLTKFQSTVPEHQQFDALIWALQVMPVNWWGTHEGTFYDWHGYRHMMQIRFGKPKLRINEKYNVCDESCLHLTRWVQAYGEEPQPEWVDLFYHTLDVIPRNWYTETELRHGTGEWDILRDGFLLKFLFEDQWMDTVDNALQLVKAVIFKIPLELEEIMQPDWSQQLNQALERYDVRVEYNEDDRRNINIMETKGIREVNGLEIEDLDITTLLKTKQINIKIEEESMYAMLGDYWDDSTIEKFIELVREY